MSNEELARMAIEKRLDDYQTQTGKKPNTDIIAENIRAFMSEYHLSLSNFWRLKSYFVEKYLEKKAEE